VDAFLSSAFSISVVCDDCGVCYRDLFGLQGPYAASENPCTEIGRDGEKVVGQALEELRTGGAIMLHDITADGFNVDHVVISLKGIFVIETKTRSKPKGRDSKIVYDGEKILIDGWTMAPDPLKQVQANTSWIHDLLMESTGKSFPVRPVLLFPGWYVVSVGVHPQG
jgi:hypothetical protein